MNQSNIFLAALVLSIIGCGAPEHDPMTSSPLTKESDTSFAQLSANIFQPKCTSCHGGSKPEGNVDLSTYNSIMASGVIKAGDPAHSPMYLDVKSGDMPDGGPALDANEVQAIYDWIAANAPNGAFAPSGPPAAVPPPTVPAATFSDVQAQILSVSCTTCHSGTKPSGKIDLSSYKALMANTKANLVVPGNSAQSMLYTEVANGKMPPRGTKISAADVQLLQSWIDAGAANN